MRSKVSLFIRVRSQLLFSFIEFCFWKSIAIGDCGSCSWGCFRCVSAVDDWVCTLGVVGMTVVCWYSYIPLGLVCSFICGLFVVVAGVDWFSVLVV